VLEPPRSYSQPRPRVLLVLQYGGGSSRGYSVKYRNGSDVLGSFSSEPPVSLNEKSSFSSIHQAPNSLSHLSLSLKSLLCLCFYP